MDNEKDMIDQAKLQMAREIAREGYGVEDIVEFLETQELNIFDPFHIAMDWPKHTPHTTPGIAWGLFHLGYELTLERIELVKICLEAMDNWGSNLS